MSTVLLVGAIVSTSSNSASIGLLLPMMFENWCDVCSARLSSTFSCCSRFRSSSLPTRMRRSLWQLRRLVDVVGRPEPQRLDRRLGGGERRHDDASTMLGRDPLRLAQHVDAVHLRHPDVGDEDVDALPLEHLDRRGAVLGDAARRTRRA